MARESSFPPSRFQSFNARGDRRAVAGRLAALRAELKRQGLDGFVIPRSDAHQNEYVPPAAERLAWLTGFTGSAGSAVVLSKKAALFVDGRYTLQASEETDPKAFTPRDLVSEPPARWLAAHARKGARIGYDAWLHTPAQIEALRRGAAEAGAHMAPVARNPIDAVWSERPEEPSAPVTLHAARFAGETAKAKLKRISAALKGDGLLVSDPHALAWIFNIRGGDVAHTPLPLGWAYIRKKGRPQLYLDAAKLTPTVRKALDPLADLSDPAHLEDDMRKLGREKAVVVFDAATVPEKIVAAFKSDGGQARLSGEPVALMKARKNAAEIAGARAAHVRDGVAMVEFLAWFDEHAPRGRLTEISAAQALEHFRSVGGALREISFPSISAFGAHAASPHYRVSAASDIRIGRGIYLIDSGGQYEDGTTDITRTVAVGKPDPEMRDRYTRVLKGHIAIATAVFPQGTSGAQIDAFARRFLWDAGLDFDHGVGHGVGAYLSVHEGPQRISKLGVVALEEGMILSNEPGYYKAGAYGIRIENLIVVERRAVDRAERAMLGFETITLAPIDVRLIERKLLTTAEIAWLNAYHARVRKTLSALASPRARVWLKRATQKI
ncbi:MAG: aminopeptidase P family protein [Hyphomicrobiales bacterium]|nr:aminopeptidase P family protein [Hyphomicrobiales bacterium]